MRVVSLVMVAVALGGCKAIGGFTGAAATIATSLATTNPVIGLAVGIGVKAGTDQALSTYARRRQQAEQDAIASTAADMQPGEGRAWAVDHRLGHDRSGEVRVVRVIETPLVLCKEIVFSVAPREGDDASREWYMTTACRHGDAWKWAAAEPAVERWVLLQ